MTFIGFKVPADLAQALRQRAALEGRPVSNYVRYLLTAALGR